MGKGKDIKIETQNLIIAARKKGLSINDLCDIYGVKKSSVYAILRRDNIKAPKKRTGRPKKIRGKILNKAVRLARSQSKKCGEIAGLLPLQVSRQTVNRALTGDGGLEWKKRKHAPDLNSDRKENRVNFAFRHKRWDSEWGKIVFSDEKRFRLDGPDGLNYYWAGLDEATEFNYGLQNNGKGVMVWGAISGNGTLFLEFCSDQMNSNEYCAILNRTIVHHFNNTDEELVFMQDGAGVHKSAYTMDFLERKGISVFEWPPYSPDLNPIENVWGWMVQIMYKDGKRYQNLTDLKNAIIETWRDVPDELIKKLYSSMKNRMTDIAFSRGEKINK